MRTAVVALCGVVLRGVDGNFLNGIRRRSGKSLSNCPIHRCAGLDGTACTEVFTGVEHEAVFTNLAGRIAVKDVVGADPVQGKAVAGVSVPVREDGLIAKARVRATAAEEVRMNARAENCQLREAAGAQRGRFDGVGINDIADRRIHLVHQRHSGHFYCGADRSHHQSRIHSGRTVAGNQDFRMCLRFEAVLCDGDLIGSGGKIRDHERAAFRVCCDFKVGRDIDRFHGGVGDDGSRRIGDRAGDCAQGLLSRCELRNDCERQRDYTKGA